MDAKVSGNVRLKKVRTGVTLAANGIPSSMRKWFLLLLCVLSHGAFACTAFVHTHNGRTLVGCNEDAWSINAQVRFVQGRNGDHGAIYFDHFNGHPLREQGPQMGMNEAGLVFDGLSIQPLEVKPVPGRQLVRFDDLMPMLMRTCATVHEAATRMRTYDFSWLTRSMLFFADRNGDYLIVENDTMIMGHDPTYAVGNWRMGTCIDPATIPIPRLQAGRELLLSGNVASFEEAENVLSTMTVCRERLGEGTLFSVLFDPRSAQAHLYFYHDMRERVTFDLQAELAKGDRTLPMPALFGDRPEYGSLLAYKTPFHQRWLWWAIAGVGLLSLLGIACAVGLFVIWMIACIRSRSFITELQWLLVGTSSALAAFLCAALLVHESVYYFGLGEAVERFHPLLVWAPSVLSAFIILVVVHTLRHARHRGSLRVVAALHGSLIIGLAYWGLLFP